MKTDFLIIIVLSIIATSCAQEKQKTDSILLNQISINKAIAFEKEQESIERKDVLSSFLSLALYPNPNEHLLAQPIVYERTNSKFLPPPVISYYYDTNEKLIRYIDYLWQYNSFSPLKTYKSSVQKEHKRLNEYDAFYTQLKQTISKKLGEPYYSSGKVKEITEYNSTFLGRKDKWKKDGQFVELKLHFSKDDGKNTMFGIFKINLRIYWE